MTGRTVFINEQIDLEVGMSVIEIGNRLRGLEKLKMGGGIFPVLCVNVGVSSASEQLFDIELEKARQAVAHGADIVSDLSLTPNISDIQKQMIDNICAPVSAVTAYELYVEAEKNKNRIGDEDFVRCFERQAERGIDLLTLHSTVFKSDGLLLRSSRRLLPMVSRGGSMMLNLLRHNGYENPFYKYFDDILDIAAKYSVCISLGPAYRYGSVCDCGLEGDLHLVELDRMSTLVAKAQKKKVGICVEGIGHATLDAIPALIRHAKKVCFNAPYRVLPVATDVALGCDHIASAIAASTSVFNGADSITCVTKAEHIGLPSCSEVIEGVLASKVAAHSGYIARSRDLRKDRAMTIARQKHGCAGMPKLSVNDDITCLLADKHFNEETVECSMCDQYCPFIINGTIRRI